MSDIAELKKQVCINIKSLLLSSPRGLSVRELERDYLDFIGKPVPFREFGYDSTETLLRDLSDTVRLTSCNGSIVLQAVSDENTRHIERLVSRQKVSTKKKRGGGGGRGGGRGGRSGLAGSAGLRKPLPGMSRPQRSQTYAKNLPLPSPVVPSYVRQLIRSLFKVYPEMRDGIPLTHYNSLFSKRFSRPLDHEQLGFKNLKECLESVSDIVRLKNYNGEWRVLPATELPREQLRVEREPSQFVTHQVTRSKDLKHSAPETTNSSGETRKGDQGKNPMAAEAPMVHQSRESDLDNSGLNPTMVKELKQLLSRKPNGVWSCRLPFEYKKMFDRELHAPSLGFRSIIELVAAIPDIHIDRPDPNGDWLLTYQPSLTKSNGTPSDSKLSEAKPMEEPTIADEKPPERSLSEKLKKSIIDVVNSHPNGILLDNFMATYKAQQGAEFDAKQHGFDSLEALILSVFGSSVQFIYQGTGRPRSRRNKSSGKVLLCPVHEKLISYQDLNQFVSARSKAKLPGFIPKPQVMEGLPDDAVGPSIHFVPVPLPPVSEYFEMVVSNVNTPSQFWFHRCGVNYADRLEKLMDSLDYCYKTTSNRGYTFPDRLLAVGQVCAALFPADDNWHRAVIFSLRPGNLLDVFYVDYGTTCTVHKSFIRLLKQKYLSCPAQAILARLSNITPVGKRWNPEVQGRMLQLTASKTLVGFISGISVNRVVSINLTDTNQEEDVHINDVLVDEGYATFIQEGFQSYAYPTEFDEAFEESMVYGEDCLKEHAARIKKELAEAEQAASQQLQEKRSVFPVTVGDYLLHVVKVHTTPYLVSSEFSAIFWESDIMSLMLKKKDMHQEKIILSREQLPQAFQELEEHGVTGVGQHVKMLTLFVIDAGMLRILDRFDAPEVFKKAVTEIINTFDPQNPNWTLNDEEEGAAAGLSEAADSPEAESSNVSLEQLIDLLDIFKFRRQKLLTQMGTQPELVEEVSRLEDGITHLQRSIDDMMASQAGSEMGNQSGSVSPTDSLEAELMEVQTGNQDGPKTNRVAPIMVSSRPPPTATMIPATYSSCDPSTPSTVTTSTLPSSLTYSSLLLQQQQQQQAMLQHFMMQQTVGASVNPLGFDPMVASPFQQYNPQHYPSLALAAQHGQAAMPQPQILHQQLQPTSVPQLRMPDPALMSYFARPPLPGAGVPSMTVAHSAGNATVMGQTVPASMLGHPMPGSMMGQPQSLPPQWRMPTPSGAISSEGQASHAFFPFGVNPFEPLLIPPSLGRGMPVTTVTPTSLAVGGLPAMGPRMVPPGSGNQTSTLIPGMQALLNNLTLNQEANNAKGDN